MNELERGSSLVFRSDGCADAAEGFLDLVTARLWNGTAEKVLLISDQSLSLLDPETSRATHMWALRDIVAADDSGHGGVSLTLNRGMWWARTPSLVLPSPERAALLCRQLATRCVVCAMVRGWSARPKKIFI